MRGSLERQGIPEADDSGDSEIYRENAQTISPVVLAT